MRAGFETHVSNISERVDSRFYRRRIMIHQILRHLLVVEVTLADKNERIISDLGPAPLIVSNTPMVGFSLAPDGKSFVSSQFHASSELWMLENFNQPSGFFKRR